MGSFSRLKTLIGEMTAVALLTHVRVVVDHTLTIITAKINKVKRSHTIFFPQYV